MNSRKSFLKLLKERRSIRRFKPNPVPKEHIKFLLEAARWAPTAGNIQPWEFIVVKNPKTIDLVKKFSPGFIGRSPLVIAVCSNRRRASEVGGKLAAEYTSIVDCAMATQNLLLAAQSIGLGSCVIKSFASTALKEILDVPQGVEIELLVALGYPDEKPEPPPRLPLKKIVYLDKYDNRWLR
jgi:nitroreductase